MTADVIIHYNEPKRYNSSKNTTADKDVIIHHDERLIDQIDGETPCGQGRNKAEENRLMEKRPADKGRNIVCSSVTTKTSWDTPEHLASEAPRMNDNWYNMTRTDTRY